jgi:hypothetical protein
MLIYLKKIICYQVKYRTVLSLTYCIIYEILVSNRSII